MTFWDILEFLVKFFLIFSSHYYFHERPNFVIFLLISPEVQTIIIIYNNKISWTDKIKYVNCYFENIVEINCDYHSIFVHNVVSSS